MDLEELKLLLAVEPTWTVSINGREFVMLPSSEISIQGTTLQAGRITRKILDVQWLRPNVVRIRGRQRFRSQLDTLSFYPGDRLPSKPEIQRRRRRFQSEIGRALCAHFGTRKIDRQTLHSDRRHSIGGAYSRFLIAHRAAIAVDPDESSAVINGIMRAAILWSDLAGRRVSVIVPKHRHATLGARLEVLPAVHVGLEWLLWDGERIRPFPDEPDRPETYVQEFSPPTAVAEVERLCSLAPDLLQAVPHIAGKAISLRLRGIEVARVTEEGTSYPLGESIVEVIEQIAEVRRPGSRHPLARAHEERWLESKILGDIRRILPAADARHVYPQVPSFVGEERNIIDILAATEAGRLVVIEMKVSPDPDLVFQALDYWIAVERHRRAGDFHKKGYFRGLAVRDESPVLVVVAPMLAYHRTFRRLVSVFPKDLPLVEIGINQTWKKEIKVLRRQGLVGYAV